MSKKRSVSGKEDVMTAVTGQFTYMIDCSWSEQSFHLLQFSLPISFSMVTRAHYVPSPVAFAESNHGKATADTRLLVENPRVREHSVRDTRVKENR